ncbi:hypothetical protein F4810DRAFT_715746 [Camillea tinctor]|nr:hypothetical protein F4810DRAFT_715746 [Camillea tinctor]
MANLPADQARLLRYFANKCREEQRQKWSDIWDWNESDLWDRGQPSRPLIDFIESKPEILEQAKLGTSRQPVHTELPTWPVSRDAELRHLEKPQHRARFTHK